MYPNRFLYKTSEEISLACGTWARELKEFSTEVLELALNACLSKHHWMPNLGEFKSICSSISKSSLFDNSSKKLSSVNSNLPSNQNLNIKRLIDEGAFICKRLKKIFPDKNWMKIAVMFGQLKDFERKMYKNVDDLNIILQLIGRDNDYLREVLEK